MNKVWLFPPAAQSIRFSKRSGTTVGLFRLRVVPVPKRPSSPHPHTKTPFLPAAGTARECVQPAEMLAIGMREGKDTTAGSLRHCGVS
tara:strand:+ start:4905 stop:5168 length:264 start_codon:yes stop_codon:yes gene_type:complete